MSIASRQRSVTSFVAPSAAFTPAAATADTSASKNIDARDPCVTPAHAANPPHSAADA